MMTTDDVDTMPKASFFIRARVTKLMTADGLLELTADVHVGDVFLVDLASRDTVALMNHRYHVSHEKDVIQEIEEGGWLAMECIQLFY